MANNKKKLWIISELFPPDETSTAYIMGEIANSLAIKYKVRVICGPEIYDAEKLLNNKYHLDSSIEIFRVKGVTENKQNRFSRIKKFLLMSWRIYKIAKKNIKTGDLVLMVSNPFPLIILMGQLRKKRDFNLKMLVHDVFPESLYTDIHLPTPIYRFCSIIFNKAYMSTDLLIVIGRDMYEIMSKKTNNKPKIEIIENWAEINSIYPKYMSLKGITIQYAGNIGRAQGIGNFLNCIHAAKNPNIKFDIWGSGSDVQRIKDMIVELNLSDIVTLKGTYSRGDQQKVLNSCDISLVTLVQGMYGLGTPSKSYNIMAAGKPIIYIGECDSEIWRVVKENNIGYCLEPSNHLGITELIKNLNKNELLEMGKRSRTVAESMYSKKVILDKFRKIV